jgi:GAF domain-containing protein
MTSSFIESLLDGLELDAALHDIAQEAAEMVPGVDAAGAVVHRGRDRVLGASDPLAATADAAQYELGQGPCLHAFNTGRVVLLDLGDHDTRWPDFQAAAVAAGARTVLSLPLTLAEEPIGSLNLYSRARRAFDPGAIRQAELFARPSALRLSHVGVAVHAVEAVEVVGLELQDRSTIDQALGVLMGVHRDVSVGRARARLEQLARGLGVEVPQAAAQVIASTRSRGD